VLMTAVTTVAGMIPLAMTTKEGAFVWSPLGKAVVGGLSVSTLVTLILVPVLYEKFEPLRRRYRKKTVLAAAPPAEPAAPGASA
jgi:hydrophobic/amphiphilic exporter-1 (mainly G- bacteria), HAE1 family